MAFQEQSDRRITLRMIGAGLMDRRVTLRHVSLAAADANGEQRQSFTTYATVWAHREDLSGRESFLAQQKTAELISRFTVRYRDDVVATDRITCEGRDYEVTQPPLEIGRRDGLLIVARVVLNA